MYRNDPDSVSRTNISLIIAFVIAGIIFIADQSSNRVLQKSQSVTDNTVSPILAVLSVPIRKTEDFFEGFRDRNRALEENVALKEELYQLREAQDRADIMAMKLARFEQILQAKQGIDTPNEKIAARAVSEIDGPFVRAALINAGTKQGVKAGHPVMTVNGLYGHVLRVGPNSARVLLLGDLNSRIAIMSGQSQARAILAGNNSDFPVISFISDESGWAVGDEVISSGDGGVLPRGLFIGRVKKDTKNRLAVELGVLKQPIDWVWVYPFEPIKTPELSEDIADDNNQAEDPTAQSDATNEGNL